MGRSSQTSEKERSLSEKIAISPAVSAMSLLRIASLVVVMVALSAAAPQPTISFATLGGHKDQLISSLAGIKGTLLAPVIGPKLGLAKTVLRPVAGIKAAKLSAVRGVLDAKINALN